ncbi:MAG: hypothetical protein CL908_11335 [Deltaproteobacteria bacterium]|nr:hypothetical protein [Deltaproteobacteria bacterium]
MPDSTIEEDPNGRTQNDPKQEDRREKRHRAQGREAEDRFAQEGPTLTPERSAAAPMKLLPSPRRFAPWLIAVGIVGFVFWKVPFVAAWAALRDARLELFVPVLFGAALLWFAIESATYAYFFTRVNAKISWQEGRSLRGTSYLVTPIHWNVGKVAVVLRLHTTKGVPLFEGTSSILLYQTLDALILAGLAAIGMLLLPRTAELNGLAPIALATVVGIVAYLALIRTDSPHFCILDGLRNTSLHHAHRRARLRDLAVLIGLKTAYHSLFVLVYYLGMLAFGIELPFALVLAAGPIIQMIGGLPITPAGLGTQQAAMLYFFGGALGGSGPEAAIVSFGFSFPLALIAVRCMIGLFYLSDLYAQPEASPGSGPLMAAGQTLTGHEPTG